MGLIYIMFCNNMLNKTNQKLQWNFFLNLHTYEQSNSSEAENGKHTAVIANTSIDKSKWTPLVFVYGKIAMFINEKEKNQHVTCQSIPSAYGLKWRLGWLYSPIAISF